MQTLGGVGLVSDPRGLYEAMHAYLNASGIDGVKVDVQVRACGGRRCIYKEDDGFRHCIV